MESITELPTLELGDDGSTSNWGFDLETEIGIFRQEYVEDETNGYFVLTFDDFATGESYWVYLTYNDDRSEVTKYTRNVTTGETYLYNEIFH